MKPSFVTGREILGFKDFIGFTIESEPVGPLKWLVSDVRPGPRFPIVEWFLVTGEVVAVDAALMLDLGCTDETDLSWFAIVTIPDDCTLVAANLKAPLVVNRRNGLAAQVVRSGDEIPIRYPIFERLKAGWDL